MKLSSREEYGLRCLLQLARQPAGRSLTIPEISRAEGITHHNVAKLLRILRQGGFVASARGQQGGYALARPPRQIAVADALATLGGRLFDDDFCDHFAGSADCCTHSLSACSVRALWGQVQQASACDLDVHGRRARGASLPDRPEDLKPASGRRARGDKAPIASAA